MTRNAAYATYRGRRRFVSTLFACGAGLLPVAAILRSATVYANTCVATPNQTEGPFFVDGTAGRSNLRIDPSTGSSIPGKALDLVLQVQQIDQNGNCSPLPPVRVDIWHCDPGGRYSPAAETGAFRGHQMTDNKGQVQFETIYPGWYPGRTPHVHFKVRAAEEIFAEFTSQLYFPDEVSRSVFAERPYAQRNGSFLVNDRDWIFAQSGQHLLMNIETTGQAMAARYTIGIKNL